MPYFLNNSKLLLRKAKNPINPLDPASSVPSTPADQKKLESSQLLERFQKFLKSRRVVITHEGDVLYRTVPQDNEYFGTIDTEGSRFPQTLVVVYSLKWVEGLIVENASLFVENSPISKFRSRACFKLVKGELADEILHRIYDSEKQKAELVYGQYVQDDETTLNVIHDFRRDFVYHCLTKVLRRWDPVLPLEGKDLQSNEAALQQVIEGTQKRGPKTFSLGELPMGPIEGPYFDMTVAAQDWMLKIAVPIVRKWTGM